jgi:hypothetical protein
MGLKTWMTGLAVCGSLPLLVSCTLPQRDAGQTPVAPPAVITVAPWPLVDAPDDITDRRGAPAAWQHYKLPGKRTTQYSYERRDGRSALFARAQSSASMLRQPLLIKPERLGQIRFSWKVNKLIAGADLTQREMHDSPVRLVLAFAGNRANFSMKNAMLSDLARTLTGEEMPYATLIYVWCNQCQTDSVLLSPRTDRIREIPLESGPKNLGRWVDYQRDIRADYEKAFGEAPGALLDVGVMTDSDNTRQDAAAWYGPISLIR